MSDEIYHVEDRADWRETNRNVPLESLEFSEEIFVPSAETVMFENSEREEFEQNRKVIAKEVLGKLTETQRRRYILHVVKGLTTREIAI
jgi:DNA-directed RNA polymerase specialized sigma24 family protein